ncbi:MAG: hypothetical protein AB7V45_15255 [Candidatus Krumholzibacteriia bacterium]
MDDQLKGALVNTLFEIKIHCDDGTPTTVLRKVEEGLVPIGVGDDVYLVEEHRTKVKSVAYYAPKHLLFIRLRSMRRTNNASANELIKDLAEGDWTVP